MNWAWKARVGSAKLVLVALADQGSAHDAEDWRCFPSVGYLVDRTELGRATVERHLRYLDAEGWISRRRQVRPDGKLGIFHYTLHRDPEVRTHLKAERSGECPALKMSGGDGAEPALILDAASAQNDVEPALILSAQEPLEEPLGEPSDAGAREPGDDGFEKALSAWPDSGQKRTKLPQARSAWALRSSEIGGDRMLAAVQRCATDPDIAAGDFGWPGLHTWLSDERFRFYLPGDNVGTIPAVPPRTAFVGSQTLRADIEREDANAAVLLDQAVWPAAGALQPRTGWAYGRLSAPNLAVIIRRHGFELVEPGVTLIPGGKS